MSEEINVDDNENTNVSPEKQALVEKEKELLTLSEKVKELEKDKNSFQALVANPDVRALLDAQDKGEVVKIIIGDTEDDGSSSELSIEEIENMSNQELMAFTMKETVKQVRSALSEELSSVRTDLSTLKMDKDKETAAQTERELRNVIKKYPDFGSFRDDIVDLRKQNPSLGVEELYVLARMKKGKGFPDPLSVEAERPTSSTPSKKKDRKEPLPPGGKGFAKILDEATSSGEFENLVRKMTSGT